MRGPTEGVDGATVVAMVRTLSRTVVNGEVLAKIGGEILGFARQLVFRDADDVEARRSESPVPLAVLAEGALRAVGPEAVELRDEAGGGPETVDLVTVITHGEPGVQAWPWNVMSIEEGEEQFLERAAEAAAGVVPDSLQGRAAQRRATGCRGWRWRSAGSEVRP